MAEDEPPPHAAAAEDDEDGLNERPATYASGVSDGSEPWFGNLAELRQADAEEAAAQLMAPAPAFAAQQEQPTATGHPPGGGSVHEPVGPWNYVDGAPPWPMVGPASTATVEYLQQAKVELLTCDEASALETAVKYTRDFSAEVGVSSAYFSAYLRNGKFPKAELMVVPNDLDDTQRVLHKLAYLHEQDPTRVRAFVADLTTADISELSDAQCRYSALMRNLCVATYSCLLYREAGALYEDGWPDELGEDLVGLLTGDPLDIDLASCDAFRGPVHSENWCSKILLSRCIWHEALGGRFQKGGRPGMLGGDGKAGAGGAGAGGIGSDGSLGADGDGGEASRQGGADGGASSSERDSRRSTPGRGGLLAVSRLSSRGSSRFSSSNKNVSFGGGLSAEEELRNKYKRNYSKSSILGKDFDLDDSEGADSYAKQISDQLRKNSAKFLDFFQELDTNKSGTVDREEFRFAMIRFGLDSSMSVIDELFASWDKDSDKEISYQELKKILTVRQSETPPKDPRPSSRSRISKQDKVRSSILGRSFKLDASEGAPSFATQISEALRSNSASVLNFFRELDISGDGFISRKEFKEAMGRVQGEADDDVIEKLFEEWDIDHSSELTFEELKKILTSSAPPSAKGRASSSGSGNRKSGAGVGGGRNSKSGTPPSKPPSRGKAKASFGNFGGGGGSGSPARSSRTGTPGTPPARTSTPLVKSMTVQALPVAAAVAPAVDEGQEDDGAAREKAALKVQAVTRGRVARQHTAALKSDRRSKSMNDVRKPMDDDSSSDSD